MLLGEESWGVEEEWVEEGRNDWVGGGEKGVWVGLVVWLYGSWAGGCVGGSGGEEGSIGWVGLVV